MWAKKKICHKIYKSKHFHILISSELKSFSFFFFFTFKALHYSSLASDPSYIPLCCASVSVEWSADWPAAAQSLTVLYLGLSWEGCENTMNWFNNISKSQAYFKALIRLTKSHQNNWKINRGVEGGGTRAHRSKCPWEEEAVWWEGYEAPAHPPWLPYE